MHRGERRWEMRKSRPVLMVGYALERVTCSPFGLFKQSVSWMQTACGIFTAVAGRSTVAAAVLGAEILRVAGRLQAHLLPRNKTHLRKTATLSPTSCCHTLLKITHRPVCLALSILFPLNGTATGFPTAAPAPPPGPPPPPPAEVFKGPALTLAAVISLAACNKPEPIRKSRSKLNDSILDNRRSCPYSQGVAFVVWQWVFDRALDEERKIQQRCHNAWSLKALQHGWGVLLYRCRAVAVACFGASEKFCLTEAHDGSSISMLLYWHSSCLVGYCMFESARLTIQGKKPRIHMTTKQGFYNRTKDVGLKRCTVRRFYPWRD